MPVQPNAAADVVIIDWSYRGRMSPDNIHVPSDPNAQVPVGYNRLGKPIRNSTGEIQVDILIRQSDGVMVIVPRGTTPGYVASLSANTMLPDMGQLGGVPLADILSVIDGFSGRIELVGHSQGGAHAISIADAAVSANESLKSRLSVTTYNSAPVAQYSAAMEARIGALTNNFRAVWNDATVDASGYRYGDIISMLGALPGKTYEVVVGESSQEASVLDLHDPRLMAKIVGAWDLRDVSHIAHKQASSLVLRVASFLAINGYGDPSGQSSQEAVGRMLLALGGGMLGREFVNATENDAFDAQVSTLFKNLIFSATHDGKLDDTETALSYAAEALADAALGTGSTIKFAASISFLGQALLVGEVAQIGIDVVIAGAQAFGETVEAAARAAGGQIRNLAIDFGYGTVALAGSHIKVLVQFADRAQAFDIVDGAIDVARSVPLFLNPAFPTFGQTIDFVAQQSASLIAALGKMFDSSDPFLRNWKAPASQSFILPPGYVLKTGVGLPEDGVPTTVWAENVANPGFGLRIWVSKQDLEAGRPMNVLIIEPRPTDRMVIAAIPARQIVNPDGSVTATPATTIAFRTENATATVAAISTKLTELATTPFDFGNISVEELMSDFYASEFVLLSDSALAPAEAQSALQEKERRTEILAFRAQSLGPLVNLDTSNLLGAFGSVLGSRLSDDPLSQAVGSAALSTLFTNIGERLEQLGAPGDLKGGANLPGVVGDQFSGEFLRSLRSEGVSAVSSWLVSSVVDALDVEGFAAEAGTSIGSKVISQILANLTAPQVWATSTNEILRFGANGLPVSSGGQVATASQNVTLPPGAKLVDRPWNLDLTQTAGAAFASFLGSKLADEIKTFDSSYGQIGSAVGQAYGSMNAAAYLAAAGLNPLTLAAAAIAVAAWKLVGGFVGSLFGASKSYASVAWDEQRGAFYVSDVDAVRGGSRQGARSLASTVSGLLNNIVASTGATIGGLDYEEQEFGMRNKAYAYWSDDYRSNNVEDVLSRGYYDGLTQVVGHLIGGDVFAKRALLGNLAQQDRATFETEGLLGDLTVASDYAFYLKNAPTIEGQIVDNPNTAFAAGWIVTLARAEELGLDRRALTDWLGGWNAFLDNVSDGALGGTSWSIANLDPYLDRTTNERLFIFEKPNGSVAGVLGDTVDSAAKTVITGTVGADTITVAGSSLVAGAGVVIRHGLDKPDVAAAPGAQVGKVVLIDAGAGDDVVRGGDLGNDLIGGAGDDILVGGKLDDWLFGGDGADALFAGNVVNIAFDRGDATAESAAISVDGGNGNYLNGGAGDDRLYGSAGSDWLQGGEGSDRLVGGSGGDSLDGGAGDDRTATGGAGLLGGAGSDQYVFGFGYGHDVAFDEADPAGAAVAGDSLAQRIKAISAGTTARAWQGGVYETDGSVVGGEDAVTFGQGVSLANVVMRRSGTEASPGQDLIIELVRFTADGVAIPTGDVLTIKDWFETSRRVEWLRFADGEEFRIGDIVSFKVGTGGADVILGTYGADFLYGGAGDDELRGLRGDDFGSGGAGNDFVAGDGDQDWVSGGTGDDVVIGGGGHDTVFGDDGSDRVIGGDGSDIVVGGRGDDFVVGGMGDDIIRYSRGDGRDILLDELVDNWDQVFANGGYVNGYQLQANGTVTKDGVVWFDGAKWLGGQFDWNDETKTLRRHKGALNGVWSQDLGVDSLEFGVGIDIQDLVLTRSGNDLMIGVSDENASDVFGALTDSLQIRDWYTVGPSIEQFVFASTGIHDVSGMVLTGGSDGNDVLIGTGSADWMTGGTGADRLEGAVGADILVGGAGDDYLLGGAGKDVLYGGAGNDTLEGEADGDLFFGGDGHDTVSFASSAGSVRAYLSATHARFNTGVAAGDVYAGVEGLHGSSRADHLGGGLSADVLRGGGLDDILLGSGGDDVYVYQRGDGNDVIREGVLVMKEIVNSSGTLNTAAYDTVWTDLGYGPASTGSWYRYSLKVTEKATGTVVYESRANVDFLFSQPQASTPVATSWPFSNQQWKADYGRTGLGSQVAAETIAAGDGGDDTLRFEGNISLSDLTFSRSGNDLYVYIAGGGRVVLRDHYLADRAVETLEFNDGLVVDLTGLQLGVKTGGVADDLLLSGAAKDVLSGGAGADILSSGDGDDSLSGGDGDDVLEGGLGSDRLDGGAGVDTIRYVASTAGVNIDLAAQTADGGHATGDVVVALNGVATVENIVGSDAYGDALRGDDRNNRIQGLGGADILFGAGGDDVIDGGEGDDTIDGGAGADALSGGAGSDTVTGGDGADLLFGGNGDDSLSGGDGDDHISGEAGQDILQGDVGNDTIDGGADDDKLFGGEGGDTLSGGDGGDLIAGGAGDDQLVGGRGDDLLEGGLGDDAYIFGAWDGGDRVVDANGRNSLTFAGVSASSIWLTRAGDDLVVSVIGGDTRVTLENYYAANGASLTAIRSDGGWLFPATINSLASTMGALSASTPDSMPASLTSQLNQAWKPSGSIAPSVSNQQWTLAEDGVLEGAVLATDLDDAIVSHTVIEQPRFGSLVLNPSTGRWTYRPQADASGIDQFVIEVRDEAGHKVQQRIDVIVTPENDAPTIILPSAPLSVLEMAQNGSVVGKIGFADPDSSTATFSLLEDGEGRFAISADGTLTVKNGGATLNFESATSHAVRVRVVDQGGLSSEMTVAIQVGNVNERPNVPTVVNRAVSVVSENSAVAGLAIAQFQATDPDGTQPSLKLTVNNANLFQLSEGQLTFKPGATLDFEALKAAGFAVGDIDADGVADIALKASVQATDGVLASASNSIQIYVEDVNEAPSSVSYASYVTTIAERDRVAAGAETPAILLGVLSALDPDTPGTDFSNIVYTVSDARLEIVNGNQLRLKAGASFDYEAGATISFIVTATDRAGLGLSRSLTIFGQLSDQDDYLYGTSMAEVLNGQQGRDLIYGYAGDDVLNGQAGDDHLYGGDGKDQLHGAAGADVLEGGLGDDLLDGGDGGDTLRGGDGVDTLLGGAGDDALWGEGGADVLLGADGADSLDGGAGNDRLEGQAGNDTLSGGDGDDLLIGGGGADVISGGAGFDTASYENALSAVSVSLVEGGTVGDASGDTFSAIERLVGSSYNDVLGGGAGDDVLEGGAGDDVLRGGDGNDHLIGGSGSDILLAEGGGDILDGGSGNDLLVGGLGSDTYLIDLNAGADTIREFDPSGADIDVVGYRDIDRTRLWFTREGDDLVVSVVGSDVSTRIENWYVVTSASDRANYKIDFFLAGEHFSKTINAEGLVTFMAGYGKPASMAAYDALHADVQFKNNWANLWGDNAAPVISELATQTIAEDGSLSIQITVTDDLAPVTGITLSAQAVSASNFGVADNALIGSISIGTPNAAGERTLTAVAKPNASGQVGIKILAVDPAGLITERVFLVNISPVADAPVVTRARALATTLDTGSLALDIQAALVDQDGSETLAVRIGNVPSGLSLNRGTNLGGGVWAVSPSDLAGLALVGPSNWSTDLTGTAALTITATATETATGQTAQTAQTLAFAINARPTDIAASALSVRESIAGNQVANGTVVGAFTRADPDNDAATFSLVDSAGGRFAISTAGVLSVANGALLNYEAATAHTITVRVTDSGGLTRDEVFSVSVSNENEAPGPVSISQVIALLNETSAVSGQVVANLVASDPDGTTPAFALTANPGGLFVISGSQLKFANGAAIDFESLKSAGYAVVDSNGDGRLEAELVIGVRATDGALTSAAGSLTVRVQDVNEAPTSISPDRSLVIAESAANGAFIANFNSTDPDAGDGRTFSLIDNASGRFTLTAAGVLSVANGSGLNYEAASSHGIVVRVTDAGGLVRDQVFSVGVSNVNEAPSQPAPVPNRVHAENTALAGTTVAILSATDPDGTTPGYYLAADPLGWFNLVGNTLNFRAGLNFDFEAISGLQGISITDWDNDGQREATYTVWVGATDGALASPGQSVTMQIEDVNEPLWLDGLSSVSISEAAPGAGQTYVGAVSVGDPDIHAINRNHVFSLAGVDASAFSINNSGQVFLQANLNYETRSQYNFTVVVRDAGGAGFTATRDVAVWVANEPEPPTISFSGSSGGGYLSGYDPDGGGVTFRITRGTKWTYVNIYGNPVSPSSVEVGDIGFITNGNFVRNQGYLEGNPNTRPGSTSGPAVTYREERYRLEVVARDSSGMESQPLALWVTRSVVYLAPIVIDLDGDGAELVALDASEVFFDMNGDGYQERTGWVGRDDGILVIDRNGDGVINDGSEIAFDSDLDGARTDLEGLRAYDTNGDGMLTDADAKWGDLKIWQDFDQNGVSDAGELRTLEEAGLAFLNLTLETSNTDVLQAQNHVHGTTTAGWVDGRTTTAADVFMAYESGSVSLHSPEGAAGYTAPIVLDLNGDGVDLISRGASNVSFDMDGDGVVNRTGWVGAGDGLLALDRNGNGRIDSGAEISFVADVDGAITDLEGLRAYDTNENGMIDASDVGFSDFVVWRDKNQDGVSQTGEMSRLGDAGIASISLTSVAAAASDTDMENRVFGSTTFMTADGQHHAAADVALAYDVADINAPASGVESAFKAYPAPGIAGVSPLWTQRAAPDGALLLTEAIIDGGPGMSDLNSRLHSSKALTSSGGKGTISNAQYGDAAVVYEAQPSPSLASAQESSAEVIDRRANGKASLAQNIRSAVNKGISSVPSGWEETQRVSTTSSGRSARPVAPSLDEGAKAAAASVESPADDDIAYGLRRRASALHSGLDLGSKMRLQMVDAMAGFDVQPFGETQLGRPGKGGAALALLTTLPDVHIGR